MNVSSAYIDLLMPSINSKGFPISQYQKLLIMAYTLFQGFAFVTQLSQTCYNSSYECHKAVTIGVHSLHIEID